MTECKGAGLVGAEWGLAGCAEAPLKERCGAARFSPRPSGALCRNRRGNQDEAAALAWQSRWWPGQRGQRGGLG